MGLFDKLKFWKHEELPSLEKGRYPELEQPGLSLGPPAEAAPDTGLPQDIGPAPLPPMGQRPAAPAFAPVQPETSRDFQVVNAKLDTLKALLDNISAKLERLERVQQKEEAEPLPLAVRRWR